MANKLTFYSSLLLLVLPFIVNAQQTKEVRTEVKEVTLFLNRAQLTSTTKATIENGITELVLTNMPTHIDEQSLQVDAKGNATIYDVRFEKNYLNNIAKPSELKILEDSLQNYQNQLRTLTDQRDILNKEETMILANQQIGGQKGVDVVELEDMADFFRSRLTSIRANLLKTDIKIKLVQEEVTKYQNQVNQFRNRRAQPGGQVIITVRANSRTSIDLTLDYLTSNAGWQPVYDIRVRDTKDPVKLFYKAAITQNTGINWQNVALTLSSGNPSTAGAIKPELKPWYLQFYVPAQVTNAPKNESDLNIKGTRSAATAYYVDGVKVQAATTADYTTVNQSLLSFEYKIGIPFSVPSDGKQHTLDVKQHDLKAGYQYMVVPKLSKDVLLMAQVTGWEDLNLLSGTANIFYQGTFTGKAQINPGSTEDTLSFVLGTDKKVVATRERIKDYKSRSFLGSNIKETFGYEITIRNTKAEAINVLVEDQVPLSSNNKIEVEIDELDNGNLAKETGKVTWNLNLKPAETKKLKLKYTVKYPKGTQVGNL